jgi:broad specificity phosphatase PhoE
LWHQDHHSDTNQRHWSKLDGDTTSTWADASLTPTGENQASALAEFWNTAYTTNKLPIPTTFYTSPLRRCLQTLDLSTGPILTSLSLPFHPIIKEKAREQIGVHTCDRRSTRSWIAAAYPDWTIEEGFTEEDELWKADVRETYEEQVQRMRELLGDIFESDSESLVVSLTAHSWVLRAIFGATGWRKVPVAAGAVYPLLIKAEKV